MSKKILIPLFIVVISLVTLIVFMITQGGKKNTTNNKLITTSFYPLEYIARSVVEDEYIINNITPAGSEPHDYEPSAQEIQKIYDSGIFIYHGTNFESWAEKISKQTKKMGITTLKVSEFVNINSNEEGQDPHFWLDPIIMKQVARNIESAVLEKTQSEDIPNKAEIQSTVRTNSKDLQKKLDDLDKRANEKLRNCRQRQFVTSHDAFNYFAKRYNLESISINGLSPDKEPSTKELADLIGEVKTKNIKYIFTETLVSPKLADTLAKDAGARTLTLDPIEGMSDEDKKKGSDYISIMNQNIDNLAIGLECS
jgi:zinc transport system substrate-binding protein